MFTMINERTPLGIEGAPTTKASPVGIAILVVIIVLAVVAVYYYSPGLYEPKNEEGQGITATFSGFFSEDVEPDSKPYDYLNISVGVNVSEPGKYSVDGSLHVGDNPLYSSSIQHLSAGNQTIVLSFNGLDIYLNRVNGSYQLRNLTLRVIKGNASFKMDYKEYAYNTLFYNYTDFQNSVHINKTGTITGSSSDVNLTSDDYSFDVKESTAWIYVTVNYTTSKAPVNDDSRVDIYIYWYNETSEENELVAENKNDVSPKTISQIAQHTGKWTVLVHHYNDVDVPPANTASYTLTIDVVYE